MTNFHREEILVAGVAEEIRGLHARFRREAGRPGETRGILRAPIDKVELVKITTPETSAEHESLTADAERCCSYSVCIIASSSWHGDLGLVGEDGCQVWSPGRAYLKCRAAELRGFARRMNLRFKDTEGKNFPTRSTVLLALPRPLRR